MPPDAIADRQHAPGPLADAFLATIERDVLPLTTAGVAAGNKLFGAAVLRKSDLGLVAAGTNTELENPLFHGEVAALNAFFRLDTAKRPAPRDCLFLATHEPCPLCLSAITWAGFDNFTYLFGYTDTRDAFGIPHDLRILAEVFRCPDGSYARQNAYWTAQSMAELIGKTTDVERPALETRVAALGQAFADLSAAYQAQKGRSGIPLA